MSSTLLFDLIFSNPPIVVITLFSLFIIQYISFCIAYIMMKIEPMFQSKQHSSNPNKEQCLLALNFIPHSISWNIKSGNIFQYCCHYGAPPRHLLNPNLFLHHKLAKRKARNQRTKTDISRKQRHKRFLPSNNVKCWGWYG